MLIISLGCLDVVLNSHNQMSSNCVGINKGNECFETGDFPFYRVSRPPKNKHLQILYRDVSPKEC